MWKPFKFLIYWKLKVYNVFKDCGNFMSLIREYIQDLGYACVKSYLLRKCYACV